MKQIHWKLLQTKWMWSFEQNGKDEREKKSVKERWREMKRNGKTKISQMIIQMNVYGEGWMVNVCLCGKNNSSRNNVDNNLRAIAGSALQSWMKRKQERKPKKKK